MNEPADAVVSGKAEAINNIINGQEQPGNA